MNKLITISALLFLPLFINAQDFAPVGTIWTYHKFNTAWYESKTEEIKEDGTIKGEYVTYYSKADSLGFLDKGDKIYYYSKYNHQFNLLYDFSAEIGDTITVNGLTEDSIRGRSRIIITDIQNDTVCHGKIRKRWKTRPMNIDENGNRIDYEHFGDIVEGIGCVQSQGLFPAYGLSNHNGYTDIRCYNNGISNCQWDFPCDTFYFVKTNNLLKKDVKIDILCNDGQCSLSYSFANKAIYFFQLYDVQGHVAHHEKLKDVEGSISWNLISSGIHFWQIFDERGRQLSGKVLID